MPGTKNYYILVKNNGGCMSKNTSVSLGRHFEKFVGEQVTTGRFASASEVVRAGLRLLEENEAKLLALRRALIPGKESPTAKNYSIDAINRELEEEGLS